MLVLALCLVVNVLVMQDNHPDVLQTYRLICLSPLMPTALRLKASSLMYCIAVGYNFYGTERMYSGTDGREMDVDIFIGVVYYQRLRHMVYDKYQVIADLTDHCGIIIIWPHRSTTYVDAACCFRPSSVVCRSVTVVCPAKTAAPTKMPFG